MRYIGHKVTAHLLQPNFLSHIPENGDRPPDMVLGIERSHMNGPYTLSDMHIGTLIPSMAERIHK
ncbi:hypothetical protein D3C80_1902480 [compost metagenome]